MLESIIRDHLGAISYPMLDLMLIVFVVYSMVSFSRVLLCRHCLLCLWPVWLYTVPYLLRQLMLIYGAIVELICLLLEGQHLFSLQISDVAISIG